MHTVETWELPGNLAARAVYDEDAESPRGWDNVAILTDVGGHEYAQLDDRHEAERIKAVWDHFGDLTLLERYARVFLHAVAFDVMDDLTSTSKIVGIITRADAQREWLPDPQATLTAELHDYWAWANGEVYGVIVSARDGREESLWGCYDDEPDYPYLRRVADELAEEVNAQAPRPIEATADRVTVRLSTTCAGAAVEITTQRPQAITIALNGDGVYGSNEEG